MKDEKTTITLKRETLQLVWQSKINEEVKQKKSLTYDEFFNLKFNGQKA